MTMSKHPLALFEPEELASFTERARLDVQGGIKGEPVKKGQVLTTQEELDMDDRERARLVRGLAGLRLAAGCYALARDPEGLRPIVWGAWGIHSWRDVTETHVDSAERIATAVLAVGPRVFEVAGLAEALASSPLAEVRRALAQALPEGPASEPLLRALANDDDPEARAHARKKIQDDDPWGGAFPISPEGHPDHVLAAARKVLDQRAYERKVDETVSAFSKLADELAIACWARVLAPYRVGQAMLREGIAAMLARPRGGEAFARLIVTWEGLAAGSSAKGWVESVRDRLSEERRVEAFTEMVRVFGELEHDQSAQREHPYLRTSIADAALALEPSRGDARALLETVLGCEIERASETPERESSDLAPGILSEVLARWPLDDALRATLIEMRRAGTPGRWAAVDTSVWNSLGPDPVLRERAWRQLEASDASTRSSALQALLGPLHDPSEDGSIDELANRLYERRELRASLLHQHEALLPRAREDLLAGRLELDAAIVVMQRTARDEQTDAMWAVARALRDRAMNDPQDKRWFSVDGLTALIQEGDEWEASDLAYVRAIVEVALTVPKKHGILPFAIMAIERKDTVESEALLREIDERATTDELQAAVQHGREMTAIFREMRR